MISRPAARRLAATLAACLVALAACACGAGASKQDVIARGNAICAATLRSVRGVVPPTSGSGTALDRYLARVLPIVQKEVSQLRKLPRPAADRAVLERYLAAVTAVGRTYTSLAAAARGDDLAAVTRDLGALRASPAGALARRYGLTQCAAAAGTSPA